MQRWKAYSPTEVSPSFRVTPVRLVQLEKARLPMAVMFLPITMPVSSVAPEKADSAMRTTGRPR